MPDESLRNARILVVDDEEANVDLLDQMLARAGYTSVIATTDARRVLPLYLEHQPDLILLDLVMPHLDGFAVMDQLGSLVPDGVYLPILVLTADITPATKQRALAAGARDFLTKPFDQTELLLRIENLLETRLLYLHLQQHAQLLERLYQDAQDSLRHRDEAQSSLSHDLGQPLAAIRVAVRLLQRRVTELDAEDAPVMLEQVSLIDSATTKMMQMLGELVDLARVQAGRALALDMHPTDLVALAREEAAAHQATTDCHHIRVDSEVLDLIGEWDPVRLRRVTSNLLANAIKYSPDGGDITVTVAREEGPRKWAVLTVADRGVGIPAADLPHVFERFHRGTNVTGRIGGAGIGLAGAKHIVEQHGGSIALASTEGTGTTVTVRLPLY